MAILNSDAFDVFDSIKGNFDKFIVRPANAFGLGGFVFDVEADSTTTLSADITDHFTEGNETIQDHIAIKPKKIVLKSYVGELVYRLDGSSDTLLQSAVQKLNIINSYLPKLSSAGRQIKSIIDGKNADLSFNNILNNAVDLFGLVKNLNPPIPRQQQAYMYFKALLETKQILSVQTPHEFASNMAIEQIVSTQDEDTRYVSDFGITLKEIRIAKVKEAEFFLKDLQGATGTQREPVSNGGKISGNKNLPRDSILSGWLQ